LDLPFILKVENSFEFLARILPPNASDNPRPDRTYKKGDALPRHPFSGQPPLNYV
jgi:hypothetical protein